MHRLRYLFKIPLEFSEILTSNEFFHWGKVDPQGVSSAQVLPVAVT